MQVQDTARIARPFDVTHREIWRIALPMTLAFLTTPLIGIVDTAVVGRMDDPVALGGLVVGAIVFDVAFASFNFLRAGTTGLTAQALGEADERETGCGLQPAATGEAERRRRERAWEGR